MDISGWTRRRLTTWTLAGLTAAAAALGVRELAYSSTFQLFGDYAARIETDERILALTFDDGPSPAFTPSMLDLLDRHGVKATFFMMGRNVERHPDVARLVLARGHELGNHSYSHPKLIFMRPSAVRDEIERTDALLRGIGVEGEILFRPPHAAKLIVLPSVLSRMGKTSVLGDVDPEEWKRPPVDVMVRSTLAQVRPGSIIGFHDPMGATTREAVDAVLTSLLSDGYRFLTMRAFLQRR